MPRIVISNWDSFRKSIPFSMRICLSIFFQLGSPSLQVRCLQLLVELKSSFHNLRNQVRPTTASTRNTSFQKTTKKKNDPKTTHDDPRWPAWDCRKGTFQLKHIWKLQKRPMNLIIWLHNFYAFGHPSNRNHPKAWSFQPQFLFGTGKELRKRKTETRNSYW